MDERNDGRTDKRTNGTEENYIPLPHTSYAGVITTPWKIRKVAVMGGGCWWEVSDCSTEVTLYKAYKPFSCIAYPMF